ncbi:MAG: T9SS type A sorting domain-containing protein [Saprospiraceae bacterium]|nr:T9SS type A sorting domain-containing protein [Saprospiraceae bacterium]
MPKVSGAQNDVVTLPVTVQNFEDIISMQLSLHWSAEDLEMASPVSFNPGNPLGLAAANFNTSVPGILKFIWFDQNTIGVDLPDDTVLFNLHFKVNSAQAEYIPVRFGPTNGLVYEVYAETGDLMNLSLRTGGVYANMAVTAGLPVVDEICSTPASSNCLNPKGSAYPVVSGGTPPYSFQWSGPGGFTSTEQNITDLVYGEYQLTVTDLSGATTLADVAISVDAIPLIISGTAQSASCSGADGCIDVLATTSKWPVSFAWSAPGLSGQDVCNLMPGTYTVTATDAGNCTSVQTFEVLLENELLIDAQAIQANCANGQLGSAVVLPLNGVPPYDYLWSNNVTGQANLGLTAGLYGVTVTDSLGCTGVGNVEIGDTGVSDWDLVLVIDCPGGNSGNLLLLSDNPLAPAYPLTVEWSNGTTVIVLAPNDTLSLLEMIPSGLYSVLVTDSLGCSVFLESALSCFGSSQQDSEALVWPGDADNNNAVNHHDLLYLGLAYGAIGTPRAGATNDWAGQPADDWSQNTTGRVVNFKNMDANGDGLVDAGDTTAIVANWGRVVDPLADNPFAPPLAVPGGGSGAPVPSMTLAADTLFAGQTTYIPVILGTSDIPADSLHGLAFSLAYNPKVLTPQYFEPVSSWFGDPDNGLLCMQRHFEGQNRIDVALSRTDGLPTSGFGLIGRMFIIIEDDIFFRKKDLGEPESENEATITTRMFFRNIRLMRTSNASVDAAPTESKVTVSQTVGTAQPEQSGIAFSVWPNPASQTVHLATGSEIPLRAVRISDLAGRLCYQSTNQNAASLTVAVQGWTPGVYLIQAQTDFGRTTQMLVIEN